MSRILFTIISFISLNFTELPAQRSMTDYGRKEKAAVEKFTLAAFPEALNENSVRIVVMLRIPHKALQFVKDDGGFKASFEATVALQTDKGKQVGRKSWVEEIFAEDYVTTTSSKEDRILETEFITGAGSYVIIGDLMDQDTRRSGVRKTRLDLSNYSEELTLLPVVLLENRPGFSGFEQGEFPVAGGRLGVASRSVILLISGRTGPGKYSLNVVLREKEKTTAWNESFNYESEGGVFSHRVDLPGEELRSLKMKLEVEIIQGRKEALQEINLFMSRPGISRAITNVQEALEQMKYLLVSKEAKKLKKANRREQEELFIAFWAKRDPTAGTPENELMDEYYSRVSYANENFESFQPGWKTDMGMIYIMFGPPDEIERYDRPSKRLSNRRWHYYTINRSFTFVDDTGFGDYRLSTPYFVRN